MRQEAEFGHIVNVLAFDGQVVHPLGAGQGAAGDDGPWAGAAANDLVVVKLLGRHPGPPGFAVELVQAGRAEPLLAASGVDRREPPDVVVEMVNRGEYDAAGAVLNRRAGLDGACESCVAARLRPSSLNSCELSYGLA